MANKLNEEVIKTNLDIPSGEIPFSGQMTPTYADAINVHNRKKERTEKTLKDAKKEPTTDKGKAFLGIKGKTSIMPKTKDLKKLHLSESLFDDFQFASDLKSEVYNALADIVYKYHEKGRNITPDEMSIAIGWFEIHFWEDDGIMDEELLKEAPTALETKPKVDWRKHDRDTMYDTWTSIYNELNGDIKGIEAKGRKFNKKPSERYSEKDIAINDDVIAINADSVAELAFAEAVAKAYGVRYTLVNHTSRYAPHKFTMKIATDELALDKASNESMGRGKPIKEAAKKKKGLSKPFSIMYLNDSLGKWIEAMSYDTKEKAENDIEDIKQIFRHPGQGPLKSYEVKIRDNTKSLKESPSVDLNPHYDSKKSFYGKAKVDTGAKDDENKLYSYGTLVAEIKDGKPVVYGTYSQTTLRHIKDFLQQSGFKAISKKQIEADYMTESKSINESIDIKELDAKALKAYKENNDKFFAGLSDEELQKLWTEKCQYTETNLFGAAYDDEVYDEIDSRGLFNKDKSEDINEDLKITRDSDLTDFEFWSGAKDRVEYLTDDELKKISQILEETNPEGMTETVINDFFWFGGDTIAEWLGYNSFDEIMERDSED